MHLDEARAQNAPTAVHDANGARMAVFSVKAHAKASLGHRGYPVSGHHYVTTLQPRP
jgi:hypothetical protein